MRTIHRYSRFLAPLGEIWGCVLYMGAYSTWGKTVYITFGFGYFMALLVRLCRKLPKVGRYHWLVLSEIKNKTSIIVE